MLDALVREYFCGDQAFFDTLNISSAAGPKRKTKATSVWMQ